MNKAERKYLIHMLDANPLGDPETANTESTNYIRLGKDLEEYAENLNPDVSTFKNIIGENSVTHNGYDVSSDVDPYYIYLDDNTPEELGVKLLDIANNRRTGAGCKTTKVDLLVDGDGKVLWAYREDVYVVPNSVGGDTSGIQVPFTIYNDGNRTKGTFDLKTMTFTPDTESTVTQNSYDS